VVDQENSQSTQPNEDLLEELKKLSPSKELLDQLKNLKADDFKHLLEQL